MALANMDNKIEATSQKGNKTNTLTQYHSILMPYVLQKAMEILQLEKKT